MAVILASPIARVYAEALLQLADEKKILEGVSTELDAFRKAWRESPELSGTLTSPRIPTSRKITVLGSLFDREAPEGKLVHDFLGLLCQKGRMAHFEEICSGFFALRDARAGISRGKVVYAERFDEEVTQEAEKIVSGFLDKKVTLDPRVDPDILGGAVVQVEDMRLDGSLRRKLNDLRRRLQ